MNINRRNFIHQSTLTALGLGVGVRAFSFHSPMDKPLYDISLAEWSLNKLLFSGKMDHLDFPIDARKHGIEAIEYVNQFFMDKAEDQDYLKEMKNRAENEGVKSLLIMCDREGRLGAKDEKERIQTVENHKKWVQAAKYLGCHSIRVNGYSIGTNDTGPGDFDEEMKLVSDGLYRLCEYADPYDINVMIENHGGNSSNGKWLSGLMEMTDHPRAGTLPDFGNFRISDIDGKITSYDSYQGVKELMPYAKGVSVKITTWDDKGNRGDLDYERMMKIVLDAGYRGYCGIEHVAEGREWEEITEVKLRLEETREKLMKEYK